MRSPKRVVFGVGIGLAFGASGLACGSDDTNVTNNVSTFDAAAFKVLLGRATTGPDATCPSGGTTVSVGYDTNGNGVLDPSEVVSSQEICTAGDRDGGAASGAVLTTETSSSSDDRCAGGGIVFASGADTNGNGVLDPSEVTSTQEVCFPGGGATTVREAGAGDDGGDGSTLGSDAGGPYISMSTTPPAAVANQPAFTVAMNGGSSSMSGNGGAGGSLTINKPGSLGGGIAIWNTGLADASFTMPAYVPSYGSTVLDVAANTTLSLATSTPSAAAVGTYFLDAATSVTVLSYETATNTAVAVTGIHLEAGATLIVPNGAVSIAIPDDLVLESGAVLRSAAVSTISLAIGGAFVSAPTASLGAIPALGNGGSAISMSLKGSMYNQGAIVTRGGPASANSSGPAGAALSISCLAGTNPCSLYNTGSITTSGSNGTNAGGAGGNVTLVASDGNLYNAGAITTTSGDGTGSVGGGAITLTHNGTGGALRNSGDLRSSGGYGGLAIGGNAGPITINAGEADFVNSGSITAHGGSGAIGGSGGLLSIALQPALDAFGRTQGVGSVSISGNVDLSGGSAFVGNGGSSPGLVFTFSGPGPVHGQSVQFLGYSGISLNGGDGYVSGGAGGTLTLSSAATTVGALKGTGPAINYANVSVNGGAATNPNGGAGGSSGSVALIASSASGESDPSETVINAGTLTAIGGSGGPAGANNPIVMTAGQDILSSGAIIVTGGANTLGTAGGGGGSGTTTPVVSLTAGGTLTNHAAITVTGGAVVGTTAVAGTGTGIALRGANGVINSGTLQAAGGASTQTSGGAGGSVSLESGGTVTNTGTLAAPGGAGKPTGVSGVVTVNGVRQ